MSVSKRATRIDVRFFCSFFSFFFCLFFLFCTTTAFFGDNGSFFEYDVKIACVSDEHSRYEPGRMTFTTMRPTAVAQNVVDM
jgi:hypothetical protein